MAFKVNYGLERAERNRAKQAKKDAKLKARKENAGAETLDEQASGMDEQPPETSQAE